MPVQPNYIVTVGMGKEGSWGSAAVPTVFLSTSAPVFTEKQVSIFDKGLRGIRSETQAFSFGAGHSEANIPGMPWYGDDSPNLVMAMLGTDTLTGTGAKAGTIGAAAAAATSLTYTLTGGAAPLANDVFKVVDAINGNQIITPSAVSGAGPYTLTVPAIPRAITAASVASQLTVHTITLLNTAQPPSYTLAKYDGLNSTNARTLAGCYFEDLAIKFASSAGITVDAKARGKMGTNVTKTTAVYATESFNVPWQGQFTVAGVSNANLIDFSLDIKAANDQIFGMNNTQSPTAAISDQLTVTGTFTVVPQDYTEFNYYINNTQPSISVLLDNGSNQTVFQMSKCAVLDPTTLSHSGNYTTLTGTFEAISNATDGLGSNAPIRVVARNLKTAAY